MLWTTLPVLLFFPSLSVSSNPGMKGLLSTSGLDYVSRAAKALVEEKVSTLAIPDIHGDTSLAGIGVEYRITRIHVASLYLPSPIVAFYPNTGVSLTLDPVSFQVTGSWWIKYLGFLSGGGDFKVSTDSISLKMVVGVTSDDLGHPRVWQADCSAGVQGVHVDIWGGESWFYQLFLGSITDTVKDMLHNQICSRIRGAFVQVNQQLQHLPVSYRVDNYTELVYSIINPPSISDSFIEVDSKGEFYNIGSHTEAPFQPHPFSLSHQGDYMLYLGVSEYSMNSAAYVYYTAGALKATITDDKIPLGSPIRLRTSSLGKFLPGVDKFFPNMSMLVQASASRQPLITLQADNITTEASFITQIFAILPNSSLAPICFIEVGINVNGKASILQNKLTGSMSLDDLSLKLVKSFIGELNIQSLEKLVWLGAKMFAVPKINAMLKAGFVLPNVKPVALINPTIKVNKGFIAVATNIEFNL